MFLMLASGSGASLSGAEFTPAAAADGNDVENKTKSQGWGQGGCPPPATTRLCSNPGWLAVPPLCSCEKVVIG